MKRVLAIILMALFGFTFGCGGATPAPETGPEAETPNMEAADQGDEVTPEETDVEEEAPQDDTGEEEAE